MPQLSLKCPHCHTEKIGFAPRGAWSVQTGLNLTLLFLQCEGCGQGIVAVVNNTVQNVNAWIGGGALSPGNISDQYPKNIADAAPGDTPPEAASAYLSGLDNLKRQNGSNAAAIMFRRAVEIALKKLPDAPASGDLKQRIEKLPSDIATPAMKKWAHLVRLDANDAAHEPEEFSKEDAKKLQVFSEMFLTYAFTLPRMLERASGIAVPPS